MIARAERVRSRRVTMVVGFPCMSAVDRNFCAKFNRLVQQKKVSQRTWGNDDADYGRWTRSEEREISAVSAEKAAVNEYLCGGNISTETGNNVNRKGKHVQITVARSRTTVTFFKRRRH